MPPDISGAASRYQWLREKEAEQLLLMGRLDLLAEWTPEVRETVLATRRCVEEANVARDAFREQVEAFARALQMTRAPLSAALRHTRTMLGLLERSGALRADGALEAEVLDWVAGAFVD